MICAVEVTAIFFFLKFSHGTNQYRLVMNLTLGACAIGILLVSLSDPAYRMTMLFYPVSILIASQLLGVRSAFYWLIVNLLAQLTFYSVVEEFSPAGLWSRIDEIVMVLGMAGCVFFCCQQAEAFYQERTEGLVSLSQELRAEGQRLHELATTDSLTGLMNRYQFLQLLREMTHRLGTPGNQFSLLLIDLDGFKEINDTLGHPVGDLALIEVANRMRLAIPADATLARLGGDEFCLIIPHRGERESVLKLVGDLRDAIRAPYDINTYHWNLDASLGIAHFPLHTHCPTELLAYADTAMFCAKSQRLGHAEYDPVMTKNLVENRQLQDKLAVALERNEFFLLYQPQVCLNSGKIIAVEALLRWRHDGRVVPPIVFIPLLEQSGEINTVGHWIVEEAGRQLQRWHAEGFELGVSINLSAVQVGDPQFESRILAPLRTLKEAAQYLDFEITESLLVQNMQETSARLEQIRATGATISVDDFGTGYSSLAYLRQLPLDRLKIDRAFVKEIPEGDDGLIARSITVLAQSLGMIVLAEGVETEQQLEFLKSIGCDQYQGYFMSPPVEAAQISQMLAPVPTFSQLNELPVHELA
jgi:diguanylate cyclase (GGDEF)-like protein